MTHFFQAGGGGLPENHPAYALRHNLDNNAFNAALSGELFHVIAPRQTGKTSLLKRLRVRLIERGWRCVIVDLSPLLSLSMGPWYSALGDKLAAELTPGLSITLTNQVEMSAYLKRETIYEERRLAVFFDEVESITKVYDEQGRPFSDAFFMAIRDIYQTRDTRKGRLAIGLAGAVSANYLVNEQLRDKSPFNVGIPLDINDFTWGETRAFTNYLSELNVKIDEAVPEEIYAWTSGHPYLTHRICVELEKMVDLGNLTEITVDDIKRIVTCIFLQPPTLLLENTNIRHIARMLNNLPPPALPLWDCIRQGINVSRRSVDVETFTDLYMTGVIKNQNEQLVIRNRIYEEAFSVQNTQKLVVDINDKNQQLLVPPIDEDQDVLISFKPFISDMQPQAGTTFLIESERIRITEFVKNAITGKNEFSIRNMLENCHIPEVIDNYSAGPSNVANELIWRLERNGTLHPQYQSHALGSFLIYLAQNNLVSFDAGIEIVILLFKYHLIWNLQKIYELSSCFQVPLPTFADLSPANQRVTLSYLPKEMRNELSTEQILERLEGLHNRGIQHYVDPHFFVGGHRAIKAICRIEFDKRAEGTGFLIASDLVLTNYHVFKPARTSYDIHNRATHCQVRFGAMRDTDGSEESGKIRGLHIEDSSDNYELDYVLLRLVRPVDGIVPVTIIPETEIIEKDACVNIIHHPRGGSMEVSLRCNEIVEVTPQRIYYLADTEEGSSGAPVFDDQWRVVALHHAGGEKDRKANVGIPIHLIKEKIRKYL